MSSRDYFEKLKHPNWQRKRLSILERDGWACRDCGARDKSLQVHHCFYEKGDPWDTRDEFLLSLCEKCHEERGCLETDARRMLGQIVSKIKVADGITENDLKVFVSSLAGAVTREQYDVTTVIGSFDYEYDASIRWFRYACDHPKARQFYEDVTGSRGMIWPERTTATSGHSRRRKPTGGKASVDTDKAAETTA
jgi:hypothetical protein